METLKNRKGSALLWCVLLIIILTILLSSVLTAVYTYYNYTMRTIKRQQAYFTARSAVSVLLEELTSEEQVAVDGVYAPSSISVLPTGKGATHAVKVDDFGFEENMGVAEATLVRTENDTVNIEVTAYYPDSENGEKYKMKATVVRQPLYFGGIAIKNLSLTGGNLELGENTDLYWNNDAPFNTAGDGTHFINTGNYHLTINGNLVTKKDATITSGTTVAGHVFHGTASFSNTGAHSKKIWSPTEYIISNKTLTVADDENVTYVTPDALSIIQNLTHYTLKYCNSNGETGFGYVDLGLGVFSGLQELILKLPYIGNVYSDMQKSQLSLENYGNNALAVRYIKILSASMLISNAIQDYQDAHPLSLLNLFGHTIQQIANKFGRTCLDVSYIDFSASGESSYVDNVVPLTYLFLDGGNYAGIKTRVRYGCDPGNRSLIGQFVENASDYAGNILSTYFDFRFKPSYIVAYLEKNSRLELGYNGDGRRDWGLPPGQTFKTSPARVFLYSAYGGENTTVVLHDGVIVVGEIICDNLIIEGDAKIIYSSVNGGQIAKQKIAEYWAVSNFSD